MTRHNSSIVYEPCTGRDANLCRLTAMRHRAQPRAFTCDKCALLVLRAENARLREALDGMVLALDAATSAALAWSQGGGTMEQVTVADDAWIAAIAAGRTALAKEPR
jgi:hypothetical protein